MPPVRRKNHPDHTCRYCLHLKPPPGTEHAGGGNCALHKEWIETALRMTCSEMSTYRLDFGIYHLLERTRGNWHHIRRKKKVRTRLFLVKGSGKGRAGRRRSGRLGSRSKLT